MNKTNAFLLAAATVLAAACSVPPDDLEELELAAKSAQPYRAQIKARTLRLTGTNDPSTLVLRLRTPTVLDVDVGDDKVADFSFDRSLFDAIVIDAAGGDDVIRMDESNGAFTHEEQVTMIGGAGNDTLIGGYGAEIFYGGAGDDKVFTGQGIDTVFLGDGDDTYTWNPGDGSDVIEGEGGVDAIIVNGANASESIDVRAREGRLVFRRDVASIELSAAGVERLDFLARGGSDQIVVGSLSGTGATQVNVDLAQSPGVGDGSADVVTVEMNVPISGDATSVTAGPVRVTGGEPALDRLVVLGDVLTVNGGPGDDTLSITSSAGRALVSGAGWNLPADLAPTSRLVVNGLGGDDTLSHAGAPLPFVLELDGGDGNDALYGGAGADVLRGGDGNDTLDGNQGNDLILLGPGDDLAVWDPGDGSDTIDGEEGADRLIFNASNASEQIRLDAAQGHVRLQRDVALISLDLDGVERVDVVARGGTDGVTVTDLSTTDVAAVNVDLSYLGAGDGAVDTVAVEGLVPVTGSAAAVTAGIVSVTGGEPSLDRILVSAGPGQQIDVNGTAGPDVMSVIGASGEPPRVFVEGWNVPVAFAGAGRLSVNGLGGDDQLSAVGNLLGLDLQLDGGDGNDVVLGSNANDVLIGGPGDDTLDGNQGLDAIYGGEGNDTVVWDPGDASDTIEGGPGADVLVFNGSNASEDMDLSAEGGRLRVSRNVGAINLDADGLERVDVIARGGADRIFVNDLSPTTVAEVNVDLAPVGDFIQDQVFVRGTPAPDTIAIDAQPGQVIVSGLAATTRITSPEPTDLLVVDGLGGIDAISPPLLGGIIGLYVVPE